MTESSKITARDDTARVVGRNLSSVLPLSTSFWRTPHLARLNLMLLIPMLSASTVGFDGAMMNALQIDPYWKSYFNNPNGATLGGINAIYPVGKICGLGIVTPLSDRFGRRPLLLVAFVICILGAVIQASAVDIGMLIFARWVLGVGTAMMAQPSPIFISELSYPTYRGKMTSLYNTFYYFGAIFSAWLTYGTLRHYKNDWSWRIPSLLQGVLPAVQFVSGLFLLTESPRWLVANGKVEKARSILTRYHAGGDDTSPLVDFELSEIDQTIRSEHENGKSNLRQLFRGAANRRRSAIAITLGFFSQWVGNAVVTYYLTLVLDTLGITNATTQSLVNGGLQIFNFAASVFTGALMVDRLGRRVLFLWSAIGMCISYIVWTILTSQFVSTQKPSIGIAVVLMIFIFYFHYDIAFTPLLYAYPTEIFPYSLRGVGVTLTYLTGHVGLVISLFVNPIAMKAISWKYYIIFCVLNAVLSVIIYCLFPETKGYSLEETALVFDGPIPHSRPTELEIGSRKPDTDGTTAEVEYVK